MPAQEHDDKSRAARDALLDRIAEQAPSTGAPALQSLAEAYRAIMESDPGRRGGSASF